MNILFPSLLLLLGLGALVSYYLGLRRAYAIATEVGGRSQLNSRPHYFGLLQVIWFLLPIFPFMLLWVSCEDWFILPLVIEALPAHLQSEAENLDLLIYRLINMDAQGDANQPYWAVAELLRQLNDSSRQWLYGLTLLLASGCSAVIYWKLPNYVNVRVKVEAIIRYLLFGCAAISVLTTLGILMSVLFESIRFFNLVPITEFIFGLHWSPQTSIHADQIAAEGSFGAVPLFVGTIQISFLAMLFAIPIGLMSAIYLSEFAYPRTRNIIKPILEILAGIPTVVYGFFAALMVGPSLRQLTENIGWTASSESLLAAGLVMGLMVIPFISSLSEDVINAVPQAMRDGSYALGATKSETIRRVVIPAALPGIVSSILLGISRAIGETMIVVMAAGLAANLTFNPMESVTTVTVQIVTLLVGDQEFNSAKTLAAFALGLVLFMITLGLNVIALKTVKRYREQYE